MNLPNFMVVGAPKAGTTSLYEYLSDHPEIFLTKQKELHYWSSDQLKKCTNGPGDKLALSNIVNNVDDYLKLFSSTNHGVIAGDISPSYLYFSDTVITQLQEKYDGQPLKIIITLRNPVERSYSQYLHQRRLMHETLSFEDSLNEENNRLQSGYSDFWRYMDHSLYYERCAAYVSAFGKENVKIILFEKLKNEPLEVIRCVYQFLGVDEEFVPESMGQTYNKGGSYRNNFITNFFLKPSKFKNVIHNAIGDTGTQLYRSLKKTVLNNNAVPKPQITEKTMKYLNECFEQDKNKLASDLGVDIERWKNTND